VQPHDRPLVSKTMNGSLGMGWSLGSG